MSDTDKTIEDCAKIADRMFDRYQHMHLESLAKKDGLHESWSIGMASASKIATAIRATLSSANGAP